MACSSVLAPPQKRAPRREVAGIPCTEGAADRGNLALGHSFNRDPESAATQETDICKQLRWQPTAGSAFGSDWRAERFCTATETRSPPRGCRHTLYRGRRRSRQPRFESRLNEDPESAATADLPVTLASTISPPHAPAELTSVIVMATAVEMGYGKTYSAPDSAQFLSGGDGRLGPMNDPLTTGGIPVMKLVQILGTGCPKCEKLKEHAEQAVRELGIEATIEKVTDITEITAFGVMMTPALAVDGEVKMIGKVPSADAIKEYLA